MVSAACGLPFITCWNQNGVVRPSSCHPPDGKQQRRELTPEVEVHPGIAIGQRATKVADDRCDLGSDEGRQVAPAALPGEDRQHGGVEPDAAVCFGMAASPAGVEG